MKRLVTLLVFLLVMMLQSCEKYPQNPNAPNAVFDITIDLNDARYQALRFDGGFMYLTSDPESTSRGIIVYRLLNSFAAYDRLPPNYPNACTDSEGNSTRLVLESFYVVDHCNNAYYNVISGALEVHEEYDMVPTFPTDSVVIYPLIQYETIFDGLTLRIRSRLV